MTGDDGMLDGAIVPTPLYQNLRGGPLIEGKCRPTRKGPLLKGVPDGKRKKIRAGKRRSQPKRRSQRRWRCRDLYRKRTGGGLCHQGFPSSAVNTWPLVEPRAPTPS